MAVTSLLYPSIFAKALNKEINLASDTIKCALVTSAYTRSAAHDYFNDITNEVTGTGYTAGGATLGTKTANTAGQVFTFDSADISWAASTITARGAVIYDSTPGTSATNPLILFIDFGADVVSSGGTFAITVDAAGHFTLTAA